MKLIELHGNKVVFMDDEDFELVKHYPWEYVNGYAKCIINDKDGIRRSISMHRLIMNAKPGELIDHINGDGLFNIRLNLRFANLCQNMQNSKLRSDNTVGYKGVNIHQNLYQARIGVNKKVKRLGSFKDPVEAARAYDRAAIKHFGEFARTNFPLEYYQNDND